MEHNTNIINEEINRRLELVQLDTAEALYRAEFQAAFDAAVNWIGLLGWVRPVEVHRLVDHAPEATDGLGCSHTTVNVDKIVRVFVDLHRYAWFGLMPRFRQTSGQVVNWDNPSEALTVIEIAIGKAAKRITTPAPTLCAFTHAKRLIAAAQGRLHLDQGQSIAVDDLASLARVSRKTIQNLCLPSAAKRRLTQRRDGRISHKSAYQWLLGRQDFLPSLFRATQRQGTDLLPCSPSH